MDLDRVKDQPVANDPWRTCSHRREFDVVIALSLIFFRAARLNLCAIRDGYDNITRLDADEWRAFYPGEDISAGHDILDFGSWDTNGHYEPPEQDWSENFLSARAPR
jgi:hypothetical protein